jgi:hypothetical protein
MTTTPTTGTLTRTKKIDTLYPPREIVDNTKARRAWLADKAAEINALPNRSAKIVGTGSYQSVSVYEVTTVEGRVRLRGVCQCCGGSNVVDGGVMVLHGYTRPGDGYVIGRCPCVGDAPLNVDKTLTERFLAAAVVAHDAAEADLAKADRRERKASSALYADNVYTREEGAHAANPGRLSEKKAATMTPEAIAEHMAARKAWSAAFPLTSALVFAKEAHEAARNAEWRTRRAREHFAALHASGIHGTPLVEEVVA